MGRGEEILRIFSISKTEELFLVSAEFTKGTLPKLPIIHLVRTSCPPLSKRPVFVHKASEEIADRASLEAPLSKSVEVKQYQCTEGSILTNSPHVLVNKLLNFLMNLES